MMQPGKRPEPPIEPISPADEAWLVSRCAEVDRLAAGEELEERAEAPRAWPLVFLDLDDVVCLNEIFGAFEARDALMGKNPIPQVVFDRLWAAMPQTILQGLCEDFGGRLRFVISSTWRLHFNRAQLAEVFRRSGLACVADCMEPQERWATPHLPTQSRAHEIRAWLHEHHRGEPYVVLDDNYSWGAPVAPGPGVPRSRLVLCREWEGLVLRHWPRIRAALKTPC
jgi:hypothetical protein